MADQLPSSHFDIPKMKMDSEVPENGSWIIPVGKTYYPFKGKSIIFTKSTKQTDLPCLLLKGKKGLLLFTFKITDSFQNI